jgi:S1-C subfamily serine protease
VYIYSYECGKSGSGTIVNDGSHVLTNAHVVEQPGSSCDLNVWFTPSDTEEVFTFDSEGDCIKRCEPDAIAEVVAIDSEVDLAVLELLDPTTHSIIDASRLGYPAVPLSTDKPLFRENLVVLGYPGSGGLTITTTDGIYSGLSKDWPPYEYYKTDALINHGNSGGGVFTDNGRFIGVPTAGTISELDCDIVEKCVVYDLPYGLIRPSHYAVPLLKEALG